jgi:hypothetical protein
MARESDIELTREDHAVLDRIGRRGGDIASLRVFLINAAISFFTGIGVAACLGYGWQGDRWLMWAFGGIVAVVGGFAGTIRDSMLWGAMAEARALQAKLTAHTPARSER